MASDLSNTRCRNRLTNVDETLAQDHVTREHQNMLYKCGYNQHPHNYANRLKRVIGRSRFAQSLCKLSKQDLVLSLRAILTKLV